VLTADQHDEFRATGLLRLEGAFPRAAAEAMCDRLWEFLAGQHAIHRSQPSTWTVEYPARFQPVTHSGAFRAVGGGPLCAALDALLGAGPPGPGTHLPGRPSVAARAVETRRRRRPHPALHERRDHHRRRPAPRHRAAPSRT
jgi:hypothetical protein